MTTLWFNIFEKTIRVNCKEDELAVLLQSIYGEMLLTQEPEDKHTPDIDYNIFYRSQGEKTVCVHRQGQDPEYAQGYGHFIYLFEKDMTIELERIRHDLFFLHAAALEYQGGIHLLVAESGGGKSTTSWALLHHGFRYASDELAPLQLESMTVPRYPHALCLKAEPPAPYSLPDETIRTERTLHVPVSAMPSPVVTETLPLQSIFFVKYNPESAAPSVKTVSAGQAGARVYANGLNQLAHPANGLDAAIKIAQHSHCYDLQSVNLKATCQVVIDVIKNI